MSENLTRVNRETEVREQKIPVFVSGLPGKMATLVTEAVLRRKGFDLFKLAMASKRNRNFSQTIGNRTIYLIDSCPTNLPQGTIAIDFTTPTSANRNAQLYVGSNVPFVMGTTGGNREEIEKMVKNSQISAVVAPNMAVSVVEVQDELARLNKTSPHIFKGWQMTIRESHQADKRDLSGTAKAFQLQLEGLGAVIDGEIESIRDPEIQRRLGIQNVEGHAYHWITLTSPQGETREFKTQIEGRQPYVEGTLMAIKFLGKKIRNGSRGEVFTMSDVIEDSRLPSDYR